MRAKAFIVFREFCFLHSPVNGAARMCFSPSTGILLVFVVVCARLFLEVVFDWLYRLVLLEMAFAVWFVVFLKFSGNIFCLRP